jgi:dTDP-4-dehydrorhamnose 3,5-epimerase
MLTAARKDGQLVTDEWQFIQQPIEGVAAREVLHVPRDHGVITETYRPEWDPSGLPAVHVYQSRLYAGAIGAWSCHAKTIDRLFVNQGHLKVVLYDGREESPTYRQLMELHAGDARRGSRSLPPTVGLGRDPLSLGDRRRDPLPQRSRLNAFSAGNSPRRLAYRTDTMSRIPVGLFLLLVNVSAFAAQSPATGKLTPCHVPDVDEEVRCGTHEVYENRIAQKGRKIAIHVVLLPAKGPKVTPDPLVFLAGSSEAAARTRHPSRRPARHRRIERAAMRAIDRSNERRLSR